MSRLFAALLTAALVLAGCADDAPEDTTDQTTDGAADGATQDTGDDAMDDAAAGTTVAVASTDLGEVLVDGAGQSLYLFDNDTEGTSNCADQCAANWPPLTGPATAGDGVDAALLGTITRADGTEQVTYAGKPLYHYAADQAPGDTNGHGVGGVWWLVAPDGSAVPESGA